MVLAFGSNFGRRTVLAIIVAVMVIGIAALRPGGLVPGNAPRSPPGATGGMGSGDQAKDQGGGGAGNPVAPEPVGPMEVVWHGLWLSFGYEERAYLVIQSEGEWRALWAEAGATLSPPQIDFGTRTVLVALHGLAPTTGHDIRIKGVTLEANGTYAASVEATHPGAKCATGQALTYPVDMVSIPKVRGPFDFQATDVTLVCP